MLLATSRRRLWDHFIWPSFVSWGVQGCIRVAMCCRRIRTRQPAQALRQRWGFPAEPAEEVLRTHYDRVFATVVKDGQTILDVALSQSETVSGADIQYISSVHLAQVTRY